MMAVRLTTLGSGYCVGDLAADLCAGSGWFMKHEAEFQDGWRSSERFRPSRHTNLRRSGLTRTDSRISIAMPEAATAVEMALFSVHPHPHHA